MSIAVSSNIISDDRLSDLLSDLITTNNTTADVSINNKIINVIINTTEATLTSVSIRDSINNALSKLSIHEDYKIEINISYGEVGDLTPRLNTFTGVSSSECKIFDKYVTNAKYLSREIVNILSDKFNEFTKVRVNYSDTKLGEINILINNKAKLDEAKFITQIKEELANININESDLKINVVICNVNSRYEFDSTPFVSSTEVDDKDIFGNIDEYESDLKCLGAGTQIVCGDVLRKVESLKPGDMISTVDDRTKWAVNDTIKSIYVTEHDTRDLIRFHFKDGKTFITVTYDHEFPTSDGDKLAEDITIDDCFINNNNDYIEIESIDRLKSSGKFPTYDIRCKNFHRYMIGKYHIMSHNCGESPNKSDRLLASYARSIARKYNKIHSSAKLVRVTIVLTDDKNNIKSIAIDVDGNLDVDESIKLTRELSNIELSKLLNAHAGYSIPLTSEAKYLDFLEFHSNED